ncbi:hypothetical protein XELAEV_18040288mg [Xenopus laevis]|uniref:G-protein coupled receptors family 1 profile domain-containing protein n=1 Tax=Xenopus laevis TaxID=8355 RepID=A0A974C982_XENLA|nr:hypothetical protein XELAEV_18040288mg [Xenopus laevis]
MNKINMTTVEEFILLAFADLYQLQIPLFFVIFNAFLICLFGNIVIIVIVRAEPSLHTPMYFFISTLSILEIITVFLIIPNLLASLIAAKRGISFHGCFLQLFVAGIAGTAECYLLAVMAFDRVLAINKPLQYVSIMTQRVCVQLALLPFIVGIIIALTPTVLTAKLQFCGRNEVHHFFCDFVALQSLACSSIYISEMVLNTSAIFAIGLPFTMTVGLYIYIIIIISKIKSAESKQKAFSTCSSHLTVAGLFYITTIIVYAVPKGSHYDRNKEIKRALINLRMLKRCQFYTKSNLIKCVGFKNM